jgi:hypothetical protein
MQTHTRKTRSGLRAPAATGRHAKGPQRRILITALLVGTLAAGSAAASEYSSATSHVKAHHPTSAVTGVRNPWMY